MEWPYCIDSLFDWRAKGTSKGAESLVDHSFSQCTYFDRAACTCSYTHHREGRGGIILGPHHTDQVCDVTAMHGILHHPEGAYARPRMISLALSATAYTRVCRLLCGINGNTLASTTRSPFTPYTRSCSSTTPPFSRGAIAQVPHEW